MTRTSIEGYLACQQAAESLPIGRQNVPTGDASIEGDTRLYSIEIMPGSNPFIGLLTLAFAVIDAAGCSSRRNLVGSLISR